MPILIKKFNHFRKVLELSLSLAKANFKLRIEGSYLGIIWYLLDPLLLLLILYAVFSRNLGAQIEHYPLFLIWGLILFNFFSTVTTQAVSVISNSGAFIKSMKIDISSLVISTLIQAIFSHFFELIIFVLFMAYFQMSMVGLLAYPFIFLFFAMFILGLSFILSTAGVYASDLNNVWKFLTQALFFITPIFYLAPKTIIFTLNPLYYFLGISRDLIIYQRIPPINMIIITITFSVGTLILGFLIFKRYYKRFAEHI